MNKMNLVCPNCKSKLNVTHTPGIENKMLKCPVCGYRGKVLTYMPIDVPRATSADDDPTTLSVGDMGNRVIGSLYIDRQEYKLKKGAQTVGRQAQTSKADVQLDVESKGENGQFMSREQMRLTVNEGPQGIEHLVESLRVEKGKENLVKVNGQPVKQGDIVILKWGDKITMGKVDVLFERPKFYEEDTLTDDSAYTPDIR